MRRSERACDTPEFIEAMFRQTDVMTVSFHHDGFPYAVPVNFVHHEGCLYFHCATEGQKLDCMKRDSRVAFSMFTVIAIDKEKATTRYRSLLGTGQAELVENAEEKRAALAALAEKYDSRCTLPVPDKMLAATGVVRIRIVSLTGKRNDPPAN